MMYREVLTYTEAFLVKHPDMSLGEFRENSFLITGCYHLFAKAEGTDIVEENFQLELSIPNCYPKDIPVVREIGGKIEPKPEFHVNGDRTLCLASPLRLISEIRENPDLLNFSDKFIKPYLFAISLKLRGEKEFIFGELDHGKAGLYDDYKKLLNLKTDSQVSQVIQLLATKKRIANKKPCPCGCGKRLGVCSFNDVVKKYREIAPKSWHKKHAENFKD